MKQRGATKNKALYRAGTGYQKGVLRKRPIIRLEDGSHINPENDSGDIQVYLPTTGESKFKTVKRALVKEEESYEFLVSLGLEEPSNTAEIKEFILPKYQGNCIDFIEYKEDFERVLSIWHHSDEYRKKEVVDLLRQSQFVRCVTQNGSIVYQTPAEVYFPTEKLSTWFSENLVDDIYFLDTSINLSEQSRKFIESLGVKYDQKMSGINDVRVSSHGWYERSVNGFNPEFAIHGLEYSLNNITIERSVLLWAILLKNTNKIKGYIETKSNQNHPYNKGEEKTSKAMDLLIKNSWLYGSTGEILDLPIDQIALEDLSDEYQKEDENIEKLIKKLGLKLDEIIAFEEKTGKKVVSAEDYELLQRIKNEQYDEEVKPKEEENWIPEVDPEDATPLQNDINLKERESEDLSGQDTTGDLTQDSKEDTGNEENHDNSDSKSSRNSKAIGDWGEAIANRYLKKKYSSNKVVWLNKSGGLGKGYDFVIKDNGEDIAYYEIKSKTDESPQLFQISGTQWNWAKLLHNSNKGDMYKILIISNAGTKQPIIREINNPVKLWKSEKLYADPVNIEL